MSPSKKILYRWANTLHTYFPVLNYWQLLGLALFTLGVVLARSCQTGIVAEELGFVGKADTVQKRLKRFLANKKFPIDEAINCWIKWVIASFAGNDLDFLVDETKLGHRMGIMMVSLAYRGRAIPLIWRCYREGQAEAYPIEGQVEMIVRMLAQIRPHIPPGCHYRVQADQGIGNSSALMHKLDRAGWKYLFRVKETSIFTTFNGFRFRLRDIAFERQGFAHGILFTRSHRMVRGTLHVIWENEYDEAWFLFTNDPLLKGQVYARRFWQEEGFRDLKSGGWRWDDCFVRDPQHMHRLILVLAVAYGWMAALGTLIPSLPDVVHQQVVAAEDARFSVFRQGVRAFKRLIHVAEYFINVNLFFVPQPTTHPLLC